MPAESTVPLHGIKCVRFEKQSTTVSIASYFPNFVVGSCTMKSRAIVSHLPPGRREGIVVLMVFFWATC